MAIVPTFGAREDHPDRQCFVDSHDKFSEEWTCFIQFLNDPPPMSRAIRGKIELIVHPVSFEIIAIQNTVINLLKKKGNYLNAARFFDELAASVHEGLEKIQALLSQPDSL